MTLHAIILPERAVLRIEGEDRADFLQGLITNDISLVSPTQTIFAALLSAQGKFQFDFFIGADESGYWLETERARLPALQRILTLYKLRSRVQLTPLPSATVMAVPGLEASNHLGMLGDEGAALCKGAHVCYSDPRHAPLGVRVIASDEAAALEFAKAEGLMLAPFAHYDAVRLREGIPDGSRDAVIDRTILLENGYDALNGISFTKGCYIGQEVTARSKHRAIIRKRLCGVSADGVLPPAGTPLMAGEREVGEMRSSLEGQGMALVRLDMLRLSEEPVTAAGLSLKVLPLWWHPAESEEASA